MKLKRQILQRWGCMGERKSQVSTHTTLYWEATQAIRRKIDATERTFVWLRKGAGTNTRPVASASMPLKGQTVSYLLPRCSFSRCLQFTSSLCQSVRVQPVLDVCALRFHSVPAVPLPVPPAPARTGVTLKHRAHVVTENSGQRGQTKCHLAWCLWVWKCVCVCAPLSETPILRHLCWCTGTISGATVRSWYIDYTFFYWIP